MKALTFGFLVLLSACACLEGFQARQLPVLISGSCENGLPMGDIRVYNHLIKAAGNSLGYIRVRAMPVWPEDDGSNVLGTLPCGTLIPAWGPVKDHPSQGVGYVVPLIDSNGATCRGYVSMTVISVVRRNHFNDGRFFKGFPKPLGRDHADSQKRQVLE